MVQGGYNVALSPGDFGRAHSWTRSRARLLNDQDWLGCCGNRAKRIRELETDLGCFFDRIPTARSSEGFAGQTFDRTVHKGDLTGIEIINRLAEQVWRRRAPDRGSRRSISSHRDGSELAAC